MLKTGVVTFAIGLVLGLLTYVGVYWPPIRDIDMYAQRAQVSSDAVVMAQRLDELAVNMEQYGYTHGHAAIIWKHPGNDAGLDYQAIKDLAERAHLIAKMPQDSVEYQTGLDDMRGTLREIELQGGYFAIIG